MAILLSQILSQDMEGCTDINALNCDFNPESCEDVDADGICENSSDWWNHCDSCPDTPCNGFYDPEATFENGTCQYNQVPIWGSSIWFTATPGQVQIDWSFFAALGYL